MLVDLKINLKDCSYKVERITKIDSAVTFKYLHLVMMNITQFNNYHMFKFTFDNFKTNEVLDIRPLFKNSNDPHNVLLSMELHYDQMRIDQELGITDRQKQITSIKDITKTKLCDVFEEHQHGIYNYDFGDNWQFDIELIKRIPSGIKVKTKCLSGFGVAPPENAGNTSGFEKLMKVANKPTVKLTKDDKKLLKWADSQRWVNKFNIADINNYLNNMFKNKN